jgi:hypothetical protein
MVSWLFFVPVYSTSGRLVQSARKSFISFSPTIPKMSTTASLSQAVYSLQAISGTIGFIASCWLIHKMSSLPFSKTFPGFVVIILAYLDGLNGLFFLLNSLQSNAFGRLVGRDSSLIGTDEVFFVVYSNIWDWSQISSAFVSFTLVWQVYYILKGGLTSILQGRKWIIFVIVIFTPIPIFFGVYSIVQRVPIYFAGRYAYLVTEDNSELCFSSNVLVNSFDNNN